MSFKPYSIIYIFATSLILISIILQWPDQNLHVVACDVGQGDSYIITKGFIQIIIDGGKNNQVVACLDKVLPFWDRQIDIVVASHDDHDHIGGLTEIFQRFKVRRLVWNGKTSNSPDWLSIARQAQQQKTILQVSYLNDLEINDLKLSFLWPNKMPLEYEEDNSSSVVTKLSYHKSSVLFSGDIDTLTEEKLITALLPLESQVLKVAHHGSKNSTSDKWLQTVNPKIALIGVGKNSYGHPTNEVLQRLVQHGSKTYRTDKDGQVEIISNGQTWWERKNSFDAFKQKNKTIP